MVPMVKKAGFGPGEGHHIALHAQPYTAECHGNTMVYYKYISSRHLKNQNISENHWENRKYEFFFGQFVFGLHRLSK
jgi:hypothetical protein